MKSNKNSFGFAPIIIFLAVVIIGAIGFWGYQKYATYKDIFSGPNAPNPTDYLASDNPGGTNLEDSGLPVNTYDYCGSSQPKTRFSIVPPNGWILSKTDSSSDYATYKVVNGSQFFAISCGQGFGGGGCPVKETLLNISGQDTLSCLTIDPKTGKVGINLTYLENGGNTFDFRAYVNNKQTLDQILSTFKFIKSESEKTSKICGGIANIQCPAGFTCKITDTYPDASGTCISDSNFTCPANGWVDCMPVIEESRKYTCSKEALIWYKENCPDYQGVAY